MTSSTIDKHERLFSNGEYFRLIRRFRARKGASLEATVKEWLNQAINKKKGLVVIDAGSGEGSVTAWMAEKYSQHSFLGVDVSPVGVSKSKNKYGRIRNLFFLQGELEALSEKAGDVDVIVCLSVLEHVRDISRVLDEFSRALKRGGQLIIRVGNGASRERHLLATVTSLWLGSNKIRKARPTGKLKRGSREDARKNFDTHVVPSDCLVGELKRRGFVIEKFTTFPDFSWKRKSAYDVLIRFLSFFRFAKLDNLGPTVVLLATKQ